MAEKEDEAQQQEQQREREKEPEPVGVTPEVAKAACALLVHLVGEEWAAKFCLPLTDDGLSKGCVGGKQLSSLHPELKKDPRGVGGGGRVAAADETKLHFLIAAGCFDSSALARLKKYSKHDIAHMATTPLPLLKSAMPPPPPRLPRGSGAGGKPKKKKKKPKMLLLGAVEGEGVSKEGEEDSKGTGEEDGEDEDEDDEEEDSEEEEEPETFSDVDDDEVANYIHTEQEVKLRRVIWSELNRDYLEIQAAKEAAMAAAPDAEADEKKEANPNPKP